MRVFLGIAGALLAVLIVAAVSMSWVIVYVHQRDDGLRLLIPAPVFLANIALRAAGSQVPDPDLPPEAKQALPLMAPLVEDLAKAPDFELLHVEQPDFDLSIRKTGDRLNLALDDHGEQVRVQAPLSILKNIARAAQDGRIEPSELAGALDGVSRAKLVDVRQADQDVRVWIW